MRRLYSILISSSWCNVVPSGRDRLIASLGGESIPYLRHFPSLISGSLLESKSASHHDRRRSHDVAQPCESKDPPDANDSDCLNTRWNLIVDYFPRDAELRRWDQKLVGAEVETENLSEKNTMSIAQNWRALFGHSKTPKKVQRDSLVGRTILMRKAVDLVRDMLVGDNLVRGEWILGNMTDNARDDVNELKKNVVDTGEFFLNRTRDVLGNFSIPNFILNRNRMNFDATMALNKTVRNLTFELQRTQRLANEIIKSLNGTEFRGNKLINRLGIGIDNMGEKVYRMAGRIQSSENRAHTELMAVLANTVSGIQEMVTQTMAELDPKFRTIQSELQNSMSASILNFSKESKNLLEQRDGRIERQINDNLYQNIQRASEGLGETASVTASYWSTDLASTTTSLKQMSESNHAMRVDVKNIVENIQKQLDGSIAALVRPSTSTLIDSALNGHTNSQSRSSQFIGHSYSQSSSAISSLIHGLDESQNTASNEMTNRMWTLFGKLGNQLNRVGETNLMFQDDLSKRVIDRMDGSSEILNSVDKGFSNTSLKASRLARTVEENLNQLTLESRDQMILTGLDTTMPNGSDLVDSTIQNSSKDEQESLKDLRNKFVRTEENDLNRVGKISSLVRELLAAQTPRPTLNRSPRIDDRVMFFLSDLIANSDATLSESLGSVFDQFAREGHDQLAGVSGEITPDTTTDLSRLESQYSKRHFDLENRYNESTKDTEQLSRITTSIGSGIESVMGGLSNELDNANKRFDRSNGRRDKTVSLITPDQLEQLYSLFEQLVKETIKSRESALSKSQAFVGSEVQEFPHNMVENNTIAKRLTTEINHDRSYELANLTSLMDDLFVSISDSLSSLHFMNSTIRSMRSNSSLFLSNLTSSISQELLRLVPSTWARKQIRIMNEFDVSSTQLERQILDLKERIALSTTASERDNLIQELIVVERLKAVQEGIRTGLDQFLSSNHSSNLSESLVDSMQSLTIAVSALSHNQYFQATRDSIEDTAKDTATLINGYQFVVNSATNRLSQDAAQAALDAAYAVERNNLITNQEWGRQRGELGNLSLGNIFLNSSSSFANISNFISRLRGHTHLVSSGISSAIDMVLTQLNHTTFDPDDSAITKLSLVRLATQQFIGLWSEYASLMNRKLSRLDRGEKIWIDTIRSQINSNWEQISEKYSDALADISSVGINVSYALNDSGNFFEYFETIVNESRNVLNGIHRKATDRVDQFGQQLNSLVSVSSNSSRDTMIEVEKILNNFDNSE